MNLSQNDLWCGFVAFGFAVGMRKGEERRRVRVVDTNAGIRMRTVNVGEYKGGRAKNASVRTWGSLG